MNRNQAQRIILALIVIAFTFLGNSIGYVVDQAATVAIDPDLWLRLQQCNNCVEAMGPLAGALAKANQWTIFGSLAGLLLGLAAAFGVRWYLRPRKTGPIRRLSGFRQASELARFSQALTDTRDPEHILAQLHSEVLHVTGADCGSSFLLDPTSPEHRVALRAGEGQDLQRLNPMEAEAAISGRSRLIQDFEAEGLPPPHVGIRSALLAPITHEENAIGLIHLHSQQPATFDAEFLEYVQVLAAQAAVAIHNAQRYEEQSRRSEALRQRVNQLQQLALIPNTVRADRPLAANLESIAQTMQDTAGFGFVLISVYQPAGNHLALAAATGLSAAVAERRQQQPVPWERLQPFLREEFRSNRVFLVPHAQTAEVYAALDLDRPRTHRATANAGQWHPDDLLLVPLASPRGEIEGLLTLSAPRDLDTPQGLVLEMLEVFATQTALAIENALALTQAEARLSEAQGRAVQLGALTEVSGAIVGSLRVAEVIPLALDQLRRLIAYDSASFWKRDLNDNRWVLSGARSTHEDPARVAQRAERSQPTLFTEIAATRSVLSVPDVTRDPRFSLKEAGMMRSWLGVPVLSQDEVSGVLVLEKAEDNYYGAAQSPLALAFANRLAVALENAQRYEESVGHAQDLEAENTRRALEAERRALRLSLLNRLAAELAEAADQAAVLNSALPILREALGADSAAGVVLELDTPNAAPFVVAQARRPADDLPLLPLADNPLLERLLEAAAPLVVEVDRGPLDAALLRPESLAWVGPGLTSAVFVPLPTEGRLAGLLGLGLAGGRRFSPADLDLAQTVGQQAGMALHNLRLRERTQEQAAANQMVRALSRAADRPELYSTLREQLASVAGLPQVSLAFYDETRNTVTFPLVTEGAAGPTADLTPRPAVGLVRHVLQSRRAVRLTGDLGAEAQAQGIDLPAGQLLLRSSEAKTAPATAYLAAPLLMGERVVGVLAAHSGAPGAAFSDRQERLLATAAGQAAVALDNLQLYEQARQGLAESQARAAELEALGTAGKAVADTLRVADTVAAVLDQLQRLTPCNRAVVWLRPRGRRQGTEWQAAGARQAEGERPLDRLNLAAGSPLAEVLNNRRVSVVADTGPDARFGGAARAWLGLPLVSGGEVAALVELEAPTGAFTPAHGALAQAFALRAGPALENARQHEANLEQVAALDEQTRRLTHLNTAALALSGSLDFDTQRAAAARALADAIRAEDTVLVLWSPEGRLFPVTSLPAEAASAATPAALAAAAPLWDSLRSEAAPTPLTLAELRGAQGRPPEQLAWLGPSAGSGLLLSLTSSGLTLGAVALTWAAPERPLSVVEIETAQYVARLSASALAEAALYETTQQRLSEQATANLIGRAISQALEVPELAERLRAQLEAWLKPEQITLAIYDAARHEVSFPLAVSGGHSVTRAPQAPDPLLHHLLRTQQPLLLTSDPAVLQDLGLPAGALGTARALAGVPLRLDDRLLGVLTLADPARAEGFTDSQLRILTAVGLQASITLANAFTHTDELARIAALEARGRRLGWFQQLSLDLGGLLDQPQILATTLHELAEALEADQAGALLLEELAGGPVAQLAAHVPAESAAGLLTPFPVAGHPLFERLAERLEPISLDDPAAERQIRAEHMRWIGFDLGAALVVPLTTPGRLLGVLGLGRSQGRPWSAGDVELAAGAAQHTALALTHARRQAEGQQRLAEQATLSQALRAVSAAADLDQLLEVLRARLPAWVGAENLYLALFDETRDIINLPLVVEGGRLRPAPPGTPTGLVRHVLQTRHPVSLAGDVNQQARDLGLPLHPDAQRPERWSGDVDEVLTAGACLAVPILHGEKALGVLAVEAAAPQPFTDAHQRLLTAIGAQAALVLENGRLFAETRQALTAAQERVTQLEALTSALSNVAAALYSEDVIGLALEQFRRVLPYDHATFWQREATAGSGRELRWRLAGTRGFPETEARQAFGLDNTYQAIFGELVVGRRPLLVADTSRDSRFGTAQALRPRTWFGLPLMAQGDVNGLLVLEKLQPDAYAPGQVAPAIILANQVSAVLGNARAFEANAHRALELDERTRRLAFLNRFGAELANQLDLGRLMQLTLKAMTEAMGLEQATGAVFDEQRTALLALEHYPEASGGGRAGRAALPGNFLLERLQEAPTPITLEDMGAPEAPQRLLRQADWIGQEIGAAMFVPLVHNGALLGLVGLGQSAAGRRFTPAEMELGMALASQAAAAVNQARLYERAQQRLAEQSSINQISRGLARAADRRALAETLRQQLEAWVDPASAHLAVYDEDRHEVSFPLALVDDQPAALEPRTPTGLVLFLLQRRQPIRLNGEIPSQLQAQGIYTTGLAAPIGLDDVAAFTSYLAVPVLSGERVAGAVLLGGPRRAEAFDESHERILLGVGTQLAAALDHTRQFEQTREITAAAQTRAAQFGTLTDAAGVIAGGLRTEQVIGLILDQAQRLLPYDRAQVWRPLPAPVGQTSRWQLAAQRDSDADPAVTLDLSDPAQSALGELLAGRTSVVIADTGADSRFERAGAWLGVPLVYKGGVLGLLSLERDTPKAYNATQTPLAQAFGSQAAVTLANVALYEDSLRRAAALDARTSVLNRVSTALNNTLEPAELFQAALAALAETLNLDRGAVIVFDEGRAAGWLRPLLLYPAGDVDQAGSLALANNPLLEHLRDSLAPIAVEDTAHDALVTAEHTAWIAPELRSALFLPLGVAGKLIGLLGLGHSQEQRRFAPADLELATIVANQAAIASHNAGLYQRTHRRLVELATLSQNSRAISQTIDLQQLYQTVRTQVEVALKADTVTLALFDEVKDELTFPLAVDHGQAVELSPRAPDRLMRQILSTHRPLLLTGEIKAKLVELGLAAEGAALPRAKSYLGVPLLAGAKARGVLVVEDYKRAYAYTDKHEQSLVAIAAPIAAAVDGAALYEQSAQKAMALNARSALLGRVAAELSETTDLDNLLRFTAQVITETLLSNVGAAVVLDEDPESRKALHVARYPAADGDGSSPITPDHPVVRELQARLAPLPLDELANDPELPTELLAWLGPDVVSAIFLPLITGEQVIGLVAVGETSANRRFTSGELELAMTLANQAAVAVANARLQQRVQPRLVELATITRLSRAIGQAATLPQLAEVLQSELAAGLQAETIYLAWWDAPRQQITFPLVYDGRRTLAARPQAPGGAIKFLLEQRQSLLLNGSIARQLAARGLAYQPVLAGAAAPQSFLGVPLLLGARVVGALVVEDHNQVGKFSPSHESILNTVAAQIAAVVENALLQTERSAQAREIEERAAQLALVNRLSVALLGASEPDSLLRLTLDALLNAAGAAHAAALVQVTSGRWAVVRPTGQPAAPDLLEAPSALLALVGGAGQVLAVPELAVGQSPAAAQLGWLAAAPRAVLLLPVRLGDSIAALLALAEDAPRVFEPRVVELSITCANQAAIALENSRLYQQMQRVQAAVTDQARQFGALAAVQQRIVAAADVEAVAGAALAELPQVVTFDRAALWLRDAADPGRLRVFPSASGSAQPASYDAAEPSFFADLLSAGARRVADAPAEGRPAPSGDTAMRSWLGIALGSGEQAAGALIVEQAAQGAYTPDDLTTLQALAAPLAARLAQTQQQAAAKSQSRVAEAEAHRLALVQRVTGAVLQTLDVHAVLRGALGELVRAVPADQAAALVFAADGEAGPVLVQHPAHNTAAALPTPGHPTLARMQRDGALAPVIVNDTATEGRLPADSLWIGAEPASALFLPLRAGGAWLGVIGLGSARRGAFPPERVELAQALTAQLGATVQNARAHQQVERDLQAQTTLNRFGPALAGVESLEQLATALATELTAVFDTRTFYLAQFDATAGQVSFPLLVENGQPRVIRPLAPQGVIQHVLQTRQPLALSGDLPAQLRALGLSAAGARARREAGDPSPATAYLGVPILSNAQAFSRDSVLGVLAVETTLPGAVFTPLHGTLLAALAEQTAGVLQRLRSAAALDAARQRYAQAAATAQGLEQQLRAQTEAARAADQQLAERTAAFGVWRDRYAALLAAHPRASRAALDAALAQTVRVAGQAVGADYGLLYLAEAGALAVRAAYGAADGLPAGQPLELASAALAAGQPVIIADLAADARWTGAAAPAETMAATRANGHEPAAEPGGSGAAETTEVTPPAAANGRYHSLLALPVRSTETDAAKAAGALLFFSARPAAFTPESAAVGAAAAGQIAYTLEHEDRLEAWQAQAAALRGQLAEGETALAAGPERLGALAPLPEDRTDETLRVTPVERQAVLAHREAVPALPVTVAPTLGEPQPLVRANPSPLWRRLALPVGVIAGVLCLGLALAGGPLRGFFAGSPAATITPTIATLPAAITTDTVAAPTTNVPASPTVAATATTEPTEAPTSTPTVEPSPTVTDLPTATPTEPLPPDVLAVATVNLAEGIVGRLRDAPNGTVVGGLNSGTVVHVISARQSTPDGISWVRIRLPDTGQTGWVGESLLQYTTAPPG
ncbi:MAG: GAF domain-containing protein [Anaerolineales bacterium]|nr:GAF domain-containing protein [Anaerolineales bacterium]